MKKVLSVLLALVMVFTIAPMTAFAKNGPSTQTWKDEAGKKQYLAYLLIMDKMEGEYTEKAYEDSLHYAFKENKVKKTGIKGASYSKKTNTLTLKNVKRPDSVIHANMMGDDFKIKVEGKCEIGSIWIWADRYGGSLKLTGNGTLTLNKNQKSASECAIYFGCEETKAKLSFDKNVKLKLYGGEAIAGMYMNKQTTLSKAVSFANGDKIKVKNEVTTQAKSVETYFKSDWDLSGGYKCTCKSDKDKTHVYGAWESTWYDDDGKEINGFTVNRFIYSKTLKLYFEDKGFQEDEHRYTSLEKFEKAGYKLYVEETFEDGTVNYKQNDFTYVSNYSSYAQVYKDKNGKEYVVNEEYVGYDEKKQESIWEYKAYTMKKIPEIKGFYYCVPNNKVKVKNLEQVFEELKGYKDYAIEGSQLSYNCAPAKPIVKEVKAKKKAFKVTWGGVANATAYVVQYSTDKKFSKNTKTVKVKNTKTSKVFKSLKGGKKYYVRVRVLTKTNGRAYTSAWSKAKTVTTKK
jgi:hypothetical protein